MHNFFFFDSEVGEKNRNLNLYHLLYPVLGYISHWFMDAIFNLYPEFSHQIHIIYDLSNKQVFTCVFTLLPNKSESTYNGFLEEVLNVVVQQGVEPMEY